MKVLVVDDEKIIRDFLTRFLSLEGVEAKAVEDAFEAVEISRKEKFDMIFLELKLRKTTAWIIRELKKTNPHSRFMIMTAYFEEDLWEEVKKEGASVCFKKPFDLDEIISEIDKIRRLKGL